MMNELVLAGLLGGVGGLTRGVVGRLKASSQTLPETIIDKKGDCEDTSFLMTSILKALNIDAVILIYSDHAAVGVACNGCSGTYYAYKGKNYFFLETTGAPGSWQIGQILGKEGK